jgi:hypothetical protein
VEVVAGGHRAHPVFGGLGCGQGWFTVTPLY